METFRIDGAKGRAYEIRVDETTDCGDELVRTLVDIDLQTFSESTFSRYTARAFLRNGRVFLLRADEVVIGTCVTMRCWDRPNEAMILSIGAVLIAVGASRWMGLSPLISTLALGATVANASSQGDHLLRALGRADPPLYAAFFVLAGAELVPSSVLGLGLIGAGYTAARTIGKIAGARIGLRGQDVPTLVRQQLGLCLVSSSSLAVGLTIQIRSAFPEYAARVTGIVLAAVVIFEVVGPLLTRRALIRTGEARTSPEPLQVTSGDVALGG